MEDYQDLIYNGIPTEKRLSDGYISATCFLKYLKKYCDINKRIADFWINKNIKHIYENLKEQLSVDSLHESTRGRYDGGTWMHELLFDEFYRWAVGLQNKTITRDEIVFCEYIEESFAGILTFDRQKRFDIYRADMYCNELDLIIEFDEDQHKSPDNIKADKEREDFLIREYGVRIIRHWHRDNYSITINKILHKYLNSHLIE